MGAGVNVTQSRLRTMARKYGLSEEDFHTLLAMCDHKCPICRRPFTTRTRLPVIDHQHNTLAMRTRGTLCAACNWILGTRSDDPQWYENAAAYLRHPPAYDLPGPPRRHRDAPNTNGPSLDGPPLH